MPQRRPVAPSSSPAAVSGDAAASSYVQQLLALISKRLTPDEIHELAAELLAVPAPSTAAPPADAPAPGLLHIIAVDKADSAEPPVVYGWGSVVTERGVPVIDRQGDVIDILELRKAVHEFVRESRTLGAMHETFGHGEVVDSFVLPQAVQQALGFDLGREGWIVGVRVTDPVVAKRVRAGELRSFSLGGSGYREAM